MAIEKKNTIDELMEQGRREGKLTAKEITDVLEAMNFNVEQMDKFYDDCANLNIEIVDDFGTGTSDMKLGLDSGLTDDLEMALSTDGISLDDP